MFSSMRSLFLGLEVTEKGQEIIVNGVDANVLIRDINKHWKTTKITNNFFNRVTRRQLTFYKFFAPEFVYLLDGVSQYRSRYTSIKMINQLKELMYENTWLKSVDEIRPKGRLNFDRLRNMTFTPEDYQMAYFKDYDIRLDKYNLNGDLVDAGTGTGKALADYTPVKTPKGWKPIGELKVNDKVITQDGTVTNVTGVYPQGTLQTYKIIFEDKREIECCKEHLWEIIHKDNNKVVNTEELIKLLNKQEDIYVPLNKSQQEGIETNNPKVKLHNGTTESRLELLRGFYKEYGVSTREIKKPLLYTFQLDVARNIQSLIRSLGGISEIISKPNESSQFFHEITLWLPKEYELEIGLENYHLEQNRLKVLEIKESIVQNCTCISVEHESKLFVTKDYIVTHNTFITTAIAEMLESDLIVIVCPKETLELVWIPSIHEMYKKEQTIWSSNKIKPYNGERFVICHYDALNKLMDVLNDPKQWQGKKVTTILDESHNMNDIKSQRTQRYIELVQRLGSRDNMLASGTAVKALGVELIPLLRVVDPLFTEDVEKRFRAIYGHTAAKGLDIIKFRLGLISFKIEKSVLNMEPPIMHQHPISIPNSNLYTLPAIKIEMEKYIKARMDYYNSRRKDDEIFWSKILKIHSDALKGSEAKGKFKEYLALVDLIKKNPGIVRDLGSEIAFTNSYEKNQIEPTLPRELIKEFRNVKSIIKYVGLKIQGECLGNVLGRKRIECHVDMVPYIDWVGIVESTTKKTICFTSFVEALDESSKHLTKIGLKPVIVYGKNKSELASNVSRFDKDPKLNPLLATYMSLSTGVRLTMADTVILINSPFRQYILEQAIARAYRKGQDSRVNVYKVTLDTGDVPNISTRSDDILKWSADQVAAILGMQSNYVEGDTIGMESIKYDLTLKDVDPEHESFEDQMGLMFNRFDLNLNLEAYEKAKTFNVPYFLK